MAEYLPRSQYFAKTVEVIFKRSNHRPFAFSRVLPREAILLSLPINSREEREAAKRDWPKGRSMSTARCEVRCPGAADPVLGRYARLHWSISDAEISEVLGLDGG